MERETHMVGEALRKSWRWRAIAVGTAAVLALGACSGDDDDVDASVSDTGTDTTPTEGSDDVAAFCDAIDGVGLSVSIGEGWEGIETALVDAEEIAPEEISADVTTMADESRAQVAAGPPPEGTPPKLPSDEFFTAAAAVGDYMADSCGYQNIDVTATDHAFEGIPADIDTGKTLIRLTNDGAEYHEVVLERLPQGETRSMEQIVALPQDEESELLEYQGSTIAPPGLGNWTVVDPSAGRHAALCFIPTGATTPEAATGPVDDTTRVHATEGMFTEVQVS
jgi:hypothetical protein